MHNYATSYPGTAESPLVVEGSGFVAAIGDAGCLDFARVRFASGEKRGQVKTVLEGAAKVTAPYTTPIQTTRALAYQWQRKLTMLPPSP